MPAEERLFRIPLMAAVRLTLTGMLFVGIGLAIGAYFNPEIDKHLLRIMVVIAAVVVPLAVLVLRAFAVRVSADGIKAYGYGLNAILLPWSAITEVKKSYSEGVGRVLLLETDDKKKYVFIPIAIAKQPEFRDAIVRHAGAGHRLVQVLLESVT